MTTPHISARPGDIADTVLLPGDPLRAQWIAETYLEDPQRYSEVRNMYGFTGTYKGHRISVQGSGMGMPSAAIYTHELLAEYGVKTIVRVGSAGAISKKIGLRDVVAAIGATTDSAMNRNRFAGMVDFAPVADFGLLRNAVDAGADLGKQLHVGQVLSSDNFYGNQEDLQAQLAEHGVLAVEMEAAAMYTVAAQFQARALTLATISDHILTGEALSSQERQITFGDMVQISLEAVIA